MKTGLVRRTSRKIFGGSAARGKLWRIEWKVAEKLLSGVDGKRKKQRGTIFSGNFPLFPQLATWRKVFYVLQLARVGTLSTDSQESSSQQGV
jgi:hypothetical protein